MTSKRLHGGGFNLSRSPVDSEARYNLDYEDRSVLYGVTREEALADAEDALAEIQDIIHILKTEGKFWR